MNVTAENAGGELEQIRLRSGPTSKESKAKLAVNMIPSTSFFQNLRTHLPKADWDRIRRWAYKRAGYVCEICGGRGPKWPVECHELWEYDSATGLQKLTGLIALCPACHGVQHMGFSQLQGRGAEAEAHLRKVNGWTEEQTQEHLKEAWKIWEQRSQRKWELDLSYLKEI